MSLLNSFTVSPDTLQNDLTKERPIWKLSSYAPGKDPPAQLIDGKDMSPEEMRLRAYECMANGAMNQYISEHAMMEGSIDTQINNILSNVPGAVSFMAEANKTRSAYRYTQPAAGAAAGGVFSLSNSAQPVSAFGAAPAASQPVSAFGQPQQPVSAFGQPAAQAQSTFAAPSAFASAATPGFGQPSLAAPTASVFGQPSLGAAPVPAFGQPSLGASAAPTFGQSAFGKPTFGQSAFGQPTFGATAAPAAPAPTFGQPTFGQSAFGGAAPTATMGQAQGAFGTAPAAPTFGQPAFGQSAFGQPAAANAFGGAAQPVANAFASIAPAAANVFGQPATPTTGTFGGGAPVNAFSSPQQAQPTSVFGQAAPTFGQTPSLGAFGQPVNAFSQQPQSQAPTQPAFGASPFQTQNPPATQQNVFQTGGNTFGFSNAASNQQAASTGPGGAPGGGGAGGQQVKWDDPPINYTQEELAAFQSAEFTLGHIPMVPPPQEMCR
ncbi:hypothetical protein DFH27DRAFT_60729 [Peziza echinospora]|nr:hypothetical protein DFH27DRAFT_60729 [Peziza echinospora]